jgi:FG-GAP-like repeat
MEGLPSMHGIASISKPGNSKGPRLRPVKGTRTSYSRIANAILCFLLGGSVWCEDGAPTCWVTGHDSYIIDRPMCLIDGTWVHPTDNLTSLVRGPDRHACVTMDVNRDGLDDVLCNVGGGSGKGRGDNEVYLTQPNGTLMKLDVTTAPHGLNMYPYMRNRVSVTLRNAGGVRELVFMGTLGAPRADGKSNHHRMFRNVYVSPERFPYFREVPGPWTRRDFITLHAEAGDITGDKLDDLIICDIDGPALLARQGADGTFYNVNLPKNNKYVRSWRSVRIADVTGDGRSDLVVVTWPNRTAFLRVFKGVVGSPYFDFDKPYFEAPLTWIASDVEVLDINQDGRRDIYVVQVDETKGKYCFHHGVKRLPPDVVPPRDTAPDLLFLGTRESVPFKRVVMDHAQPGCGNFAQRWDDRTMLLAQGSFDNPGYQLLLEW